MDGNTSRPNSNKTVFPDTNSMVAVCGVLPLICIFGIALNGVSIWFFICEKEHGTPESSWSEAQGSVRRPRNSRKASRFQIYLTAMCVFDLTALLLAMYLIPAQVLTEYFRRFHRRPSMLRYLIRTPFIYSSPILSPLYAIMNCASMWTIVAISLQRYLAICHPLYHQKLKSRPRIMCAVIACAALVFNMPRFFHSKWDYSREGVVILRERFHGELFNQIDHSIAFVTNFLIPYPLLLFLNLRMLCGIYSSSSRALLRRTSSSTVDTHAAAEQRAVLMILTIICTTVFCHTLTIFNHLVKIVAPHHYDQHKYAWILHDMQILLVNLNCAVHPLIYIAFTRRYRFRFWNNFTPNARNRIRLQGCGNRSNASVGIEAELMQRLNIMNGNNRFAPNASTETSTETNTIDKSYEMK